MFLRMFQVFRIFLEGFLQMFLRMFKVFMIFFKRISNDVFKDV